MKPREFDELVRQKFDRNDFAYNPEMWDQLAEKLDGRAKKRSMLMWLWMPAAGMAASVALAIGVTSLLNFGQLDTGSKYVAYTGVGHMMPHNITEAPVAMVHDIPVIETTKKQINAKTNTSIQPASVKHSSAIGIKLHNVVSGTSVDAGVAVNEFHATVSDVVLPKENEKQVEVRHRVYHTFKHNVNTQRKPLRLSVILSGGVNQGNSNSGYMAGATVRKMINEKVFVEGDFAFATSDNIQRTKYMSYESATPTGGYSGSGSGAAKPGSASKTTNTTDGSNLPGNNAPVGVIKTQDISYSLYYAQVTPSIGYKVAKRMSIGMGPDFQKMLVDNRPATSEVDRGNLQVAPTFDVGFVGKTEYALTKRVKAGICYRKGINGVINPSDKYIDRNYIQFQMRCTIFNR